MPVDVETIEIDRQRRMVAAYASDPDNATAWYENIRSVDWKTPRPCRRRLSIVFVARFLGRRLAYTYEVREMVADERLGMRTAEGTLPDGDDLHVGGRSRGRTIMTLRNRGEPSDRPSFWARLMALAIRRANRKDPARLKAVLRPNRETEH